MWRKGMKYKIIHPGVSAWGSTKSAVWYWGEGWLCNIDLAGNRCWLLLSVVKRLFCSCPILSPCFQFLTGLLLTVLTDIIHISVFYPSHDFLSDAKRFSIGMAIFSLLLKPVSCYLVYRMYRERGGEYTFNIGRMLSLLPCQCGPPPQVLRGLPCTLDPSAWPLCNWILPSFPGRWGACSLFFIFLLPFCRSGVSLALNLYSSSLPLQTWSFWQPLCPQGCCERLSSLPPPAFVCLLETFGYPFFVKPFFSFWGKVEAAFPLAGLWTRGK